jgi:hypothetical protein
MEKVFCPVPWDTISTRTNGGLRVCCQSNQSSCRGILRRKDDSQYNLTDGDFKEFRNSEKLKKMRIEMLEGKWPSECIEVHPKN